MGYILDISKWQQDVDFAKVAELYRNGTIDGVIIRVQHGYTIPDEKYQTYVAECKKYGIPFGTYAYYAAVSVNDAIAEADTAFDRTDKDSKCFVVDIEEATMSDLVAGGQAYIDRLKVRGMKNVGKYSYTGFYNEHNLGAINADWTWVAAYGVNDGQPHTQPNVEGIDLWQFTSTAHVNGISTEVDESKITDPNGFPFFKSQAIVCPKVIMRVKALVRSDIRNAPSHTAGYVRDAIPPEEFDVYQIINKDGTQWHLVGGDPVNGEFWIDGNNGQNLYWIDNPNIVKQATPQPVYYVIVSGDNLTSIAKKFGTTLAQLKVWNNIANENLIYAGEKIRVK